MELVKKKQEYLFCEHIPGTQQCCGSCHNDDEYGDHMLEDFFNSRTCNYYLVLCCGSTTNYAVLKRKHGERGAIARMLAEKRNA